MNRSILSLSNLQKLAASLLLISATVLTASEQPSQKRSPITVSFENGDAESAEEGKKIIAECARRFEEITHHKLGEWTVRVSFKSEVTTGGMNLHGHNHLRGVTTHSAASSTIEISTHQRSSWGRVLAHEVTHAFVREAYGKALNTTLNEGLAEYLAHQMYPSEVQSDLRNAAKGRVSEKLLPYVEGYRFCAEHAQEHGFSSFLAREIKTGKNSYACLNYEWNSQATSK